MTVPDDLTRPADPNVHDPSDTLVGPYRLIREIGSGGMGTVYLAVRDDDAFQKRVAIKVLRRGMDTDAIIRRFRHERQILAGLQHPYIAGLLDGGSTADGRRISRWSTCRGNRFRTIATRKLDTTAKLELFRTVCAAVPQDRLTVGPDPFYDMGRDVSPTIGQCSPTTTKTRHSAPPS